MERYYEAYGKKGIQGNTEQVMKTIVSRYIRENPESPYTFRAFHAEGFRQEESGRWVLDFDGKFPEAKEGEWACAVAEVFAERDGSFRMSFTGHNPVWIYADGKEVAATNCQDEVLNESRVFSWEAAKGFHRIFVKARKNVLGFRCVLGTVSPKWAPVNFYTALARNKGQLGWNYCGPLSEAGAEEMFLRYGMPAGRESGRTDGSGPKDREIGGTEEEQENGGGLKDGEIGGTEEGRENESGPKDREIVGTEESRKVGMAEWLPVERSWSFPRRKAVYAVSFCRCGQDGEVSFRFRVPEHRYQVYVDGEARFSEKEEEGSLSLKAGLHRLAVRIEGTTEKTVLEGWVQGEQGKANLCLPDHIQGVSGNWLYLDCDDERAKQGFDGNMLYDGWQGKTCFQSADGVYLRPVQEAPLYGKSNYPIGVVLYGLLTAGKYLQDREIMDYAHRHLLQTCKIQEYVHWDSMRYGYACVNQQLVSLSALDDCGAFFAGALEDYLEYSREDELLSGVEEAAEYILKKQERLENGMFYRRMEGKAAQFTVWADDLYMSLPFLIRYAKLKDRPELWEDAINQIRRFKELLYLPEKKLMSHVYQLKLGLATKIPWGRGNGWVLFTLSELLKALPEEQAGYQEVKNFFRELCEGFLQVTDEEGMLHQVLDEPDSYGEASCSAMCAAAFARGVKAGILPENPYGRAAGKIAEALKRFCIDEEGNVYGVCMGSSYSFRREYYKRELGWRINDTHGTGIVLLALAETAELEESMLTEKR